MQKQRRKRGKPLRRVTQVVQAARVFERHYQTSAASHYQHTCKQYNKGPPGHGTLGRFSKIETRVLTGATVRARSGAGLGPMIKDLGVGRASLRACSGWGRPGKKVPEALVWGISKSAARCHALNHGDPGFHRDKLGARGHEREGEGAGEGAIGETGEKVGEGAHTLGV